ISKKGNHDVIRVAEVLHALFYTPQFVAIHLGSFEEEGLQIELMTANDGRLVIEQLLKGEADIGLSGPMRTLKLADESDQDRLINFIEVNSLNGFFLLSRTPKENFQWGDLVGKTLIEFAEAPTPWLCLQYVLKKNGLDPSSVNVIRDLKTPQALEAFRSGRADYMEQSQPATELLLQEGSAHLVASMGEVIGLLPFSAYVATPQFLENHRHLAERFTRAVYKAQQWLASHSAQEISTLIAPSFPDIDPSIRQRAIERYQQQGTWAKDPLLRQPGFDYLQEILLTGQFIRRKFEYRELVDDELARKVVEM
ncbi:MAG: ABC transporter substrate-binding protein, partial [Candidatus Tectomicrobia bacterium]|nr:ABC transporter substrate-binding protein [Candidatus Tectomicrobia bacterium]